jgi:FixJ family two-component response regulator
MPYIKREERPAVDLANKPKDTGELNYLVTRLVQRFLSRDGKAPRYADFNAAMGALECCKLELYRRMIAPYEDKKIAENGDVY